jgi:hypothetical protein
MNKRLRIERLEATQSTAADHAPPQARLRGI